MAKWIVQIIISLTLGVAGQLLFKEGATKMNVTFSGADGIVQLIGRMMANPWLILGVICYGISTFFWILVLKEKDLSMVYPMIASGYILVVLFSWLVRHESISAGRWMGSLVIALGVFLISRS
jgi:drug/metabolite transporter (DMT)-like permease